MSKVIQKLNPDYKSIRFHSKCTLTKGQSIDINH